MTSSRSVRGLVANVAVALALLCGACAAADPAPPTACWPMSTLPVMLPKGEPAGSPVMIFVPLPQRSEHGVALSAPPEIAESESFSEIFVIRPHSFFGGASRWVIAVDGLDTHGICTDEYARLSVVPGQHTVSIRWWGGWWPGWHEDKQVVTTESGGEYYFLVGPSLRGARMDPVGRGMGQHELIGRRGL